MTQPDFMSSCWQKSEFKSKHVRKHGPEAFWIFLIFLGWRRHATTRHGNTWSWSAPPSRGRNTSWGPPLTSTSQSYSELCFGFVFLRLFSGFVGGILRFFKVLGGSGGFWKHFEGCWMIWGVVTFVDVGILFFGLQVSGFLIFFQRIWFRFPNGARKTSC